MTEEELEIIISDMLDEEGKKGQKQPLNIFYLLTTKRTEYMISVWKQEQQS